MHISAIKEISTALGEISSHAASGLADIENNGFSMHDGVFYSLPPEQARKYNELVKDFIAKNKYTDRFSYEFVSKKLKTIFAKILSHGIAVAESEITSLRAELDSYDQTHSVYLPIDGLLVAEPTRLGNVNLQMCTPELIDEIFKEASFLDRQVKENPAKEQQVTFVQDDVSKKFGGRCVAKVEIRAEPTRAYERGTDDVRRVIDVLRFASKAIYPIGEDIRIGVVGDHPRSRRTGVVVNSECLNTKNDNVGSVRPFELGAKSIERMKELGADKLLEFLQEENPSQFKECLVRATHWFSSAITQSELENAFLHLIIALETMFTPEQGNPISASVAEATALVVAEKLEDRKRIKSKIKEFYSSRSGIAHGGKKYVTEVDLYNLMSIVGSCIVSLIERSEEFKTQKELMNHIENLKLS